MATDKERADRRMSKDDRVFVAVSVIGGALLLGAGIFLAYTDMPQVVSLGAGFVGGLCIGGGLIIARVARRGL